MVALLSVKKGIVKWHLILYDSIICNLQSPTCNNQTDCGLRKKERGFLWYNKIHWYNTAQGG